MGYIVLIVSLVVLLAPVIVYLSVKSGTVGYLRGRQFIEREKTNGDDEEEA